MRVPVQSLGPGAVIGGYEIDHLLGHGTMGEVYLARQTQMQRMVALKILPKADDVLLEYFRREVRTLAKLDHPHIVSAFEAGEEKGICYLAMSYIKGETLTERVERMGPFHERDALEIVRQVGSALSYAWTSQRMLHRDVKPANIMLENGTDTKLMDLGLSCSLQLDGDGVTLDAIGTPDYMAPEVIASQPGQDFRLDLYSLGATLYYLLSGKPPYGPGPVDEVLASHARDPIPDPRRFEPSISDGSAMLVAWMLAKRPADRPLTWANWEKAIAAVSVGMAPVKLQALIPVDIPEPNMEAGSASGIRHRVAPGSKTLVARRRSNSTSTASGASSRGTTHIKTDQFTSEQIAGAVANRIEELAAEKKAAKPPKPAGPPKPPWFWPTIIGASVLLLLLILAGIVAARLI